MLKRLGVVFHTCNPSTQEAEAGGFCIPDSLDYTGKPVLNQTKNNNRKNHIKRKKIMPSDVFSKEKKT
jgi:hypothetical protein